MKVQAHCGLISPNSPLPFHRECRGSEDKRVCSGGGVIWECRGSEDNTRVCSGGGVIWECRGSEDNTRVCSGGGVIGSAEGVRTTQGYVVVVG